MNGFAVRFEPTENPGIERFQVEGPDAFVMGMVGAPKDVANSFGKTTNPARWRLLRSFKHPVAWIDRVKVAEWKRGRGVGTAIMRETLRILGESGVRYVVLSPRAEGDIDPLRLDEFYRKLGFVEIRSFGGTSLWSKVMVLDLAQNPS